MKPAAEWTNDCCGKKDYDGKIVVVSTRYWPKGGSTMVFDSGHPELGLRAYDDGSPASAHSSILLVGSGEELVLTEVQKTGAGFNEVSLAVEEWVQEQMNRIESALRMEFQGCK